MTKKSEIILTPASIVLVGRGTKLLLSAEFELFVPF
jgi:hypothetical protein